MNSLVLSPELSLPLSIVTSTQAILARKRSGKSYTAQKLAEQMLQAGQQIVAIDPTSAWWGLRSSADGTGPGFPIFVFGGEHADVPLSPDSGAVMARAVVEHGFSAVFDVGEFEVEQQLLFGTAFCKELLRLNRTAMHLFMDEAHNWAAQSPVTRQEKAALGATKRLVLQGGIRGIGFTMISQRSQLLNKDILSQVDMLTVLRMSHPLDIKAATDWLASEVSSEFAAEVKAALPSLPVGTAFVASGPLGFGRRVTIAPKQTFNSGATPIPGHARAVPKVLAPIDIARLGQQIAQAAEEQKRTSPEYLQQRIADLEKQIAGGKDARAEVELRAASDRIVTLEHQLERSQLRIASLEEVVSTFAEQASRLLALQPPPTLEIPLPSRPLLPEKTSTERPLSFAPAVIKAPKRPSQTPPVRALSKAERAILTVLAQAGPCSKSKVAAWTGYSASGGGFGNAISSARTAGLLTGSDPLIITAEGQRALGDQWAALPKGKALLSHWSAKLGKAEREILTTIPHHGGPIDKQELAKRIGYVATGGGFNNALSRLRTLELVQGSSSISLTPDFAKAIGAR